MEIDVSNKEFFYAYQLVEEEHQNVFLTGKAGTGKTTFLKYLKENSNRNIVIAAPTGVAAINAGGVTLHSLFHINPGSLYYYDDFRLRKNVPPGDINKETIYDYFKFPRHKREILENIDLLVIDEISMVRCDILDVVDKVLRIFGGGDYYSPFGGKQLLLIGDCFQLPPVVERGAEDILGLHYETPYFFSAKSFDEADLDVVELKKIYRQQNDLAYINLLNRVRVNEITDEDIDLLNSKVERNFDFTHENYIFLGTHNNTVNQMNLKKLSELDGPSKVYEAKVWGDFDEKDFPTSKNLELRKGAQVMFIKNDSGKRYYNGKIGKVAHVSSDQIRVITDVSEEITLNPSVWEKIKYEWNAKEKKIVEKVVGTFTQYPLKLAWALTINKSQGLTFERVYVDLPDAFAHGHVYVALSRCTTFAGLKLARTIDRFCIIIDDRVVRFYNSLFQEDILGDDIVSKGIKEVTDFTKETIIKPEKPKALAPVPSIPIFTTNKLTVSNGETVILKWETINAVKIQIIPHGYVSDNGEIAICPRKDTVYTITATNEAGLSNSKSIEVKVSKVPPQIIYFKTNYTLVFENSEFELSWKVEGAEKVEIQPDIGVVSAEGHRKVSVKEYTVFKLRAISFYGYSSVTEVAVQTVPPPLIERVLVPDLMVTSTVNIEINARVLPEVDIQLQSVIDTIVEMPVNHIELNEDLLTKNNLKLDSNYATFPKGYFQHLVVGFESFIQGLIDKLKKSFDQ